MKIKKLLFASALLFSAYNASAQTQVIAHRGFWKTEGSAQNSIAALLKADSIGCYGSEFDVWLAADDQLVVNHDPTFKGKRMENSPSTALTASKLDNGEKRRPVARYCRNSWSMKQRYCFSVAFIERDRRRNAYGPNGKILSSGKEERCRTVRRGVSEYCVRQG